MGESWQAWAGKVCLSEDMLDVCNQLLELELLDSCPIANSYMIETRIERGHREPSNKTQKQATKNTEKLMQTNLFQKKMQFALPHL